MIIVYLFTSVIVYAQNTVYGKDYIDWGSHYHQVVLLMNFDTFSYLGLRQIQDFMNRYQFEVYSETRDWKTVSNGSEEEEEEEVSFDMVICCCEIDINGMKFSIGVV